MGRGGWRDHGGRTGGAFLTILGGTPLFATGGAPWTLVPDADEPRHWWLRSPRVIVPAREDFALITIPPGLSSIDGGEPPATEASDKIVEHDKFSGIDITGASGTLVENGEGEPAQHLLLTTKGFAAPAEIASRLEIRYLPSSKDADPWPAPATIPAEIVAKASLVKLTMVPAAEPFTGVHAWRLPSAPGNPDRLRDRPESRPR